MILRHLPRNLLGLGQCVTSGMLGTWFHGPYLVFKYFSSKLPFYREENFYRGGILTLTHGDGDGPFVYDPYPDYNGDEWRKVSLGSFQACTGPRGRLLSRSSADDMVSVYPGIPDSKYKLAENFESFLTPHVNRIPSSIAWIVYGNGTRCVCL